LCTSFRDKKLSVFVRFFVPLPSCPCGVVRGDYSKYSGVRPSFSTKANNAVAAVSGSVCRAFRLSYSLSERHPPTGFGCDCERPFPLPLSPTRLSTWIDHRNGSRGAHTGKETAKCRGKQPCRDLLPIPIGINLDRERQNKATRGRTDLVQNWKQWRKELWWWGLLYRMPAAAAAAASRSAVWYAWCSAKRFVPDTLFPWFILC
jgi:hypothetical protein